MDGTTATTCRAGRTRTTLATLIAVFVSAHAAAADSREPRLVGRVRHVVDGDTLVVQLDSGPVEVRLANVDAPEHDQPGGEDATRAVTRHLGREAEVALEPVKQDDYGRIVAVAYVGNEDLEQWLLRQGHVWAYRHYVRDERYCRWEDEARSARRGLWSLPSSQRIAPWEWRHRRPEIEAGRYRVYEATLAQCLAEVRRPRGEPAQRQLEHEEGARW